MTQEEKTKTMEVEDKDNGNRCPDYDDECMDVRDHYACYLGINCKDGVAKGYCPFIHTSN